MNIGKMVRLTNSLENLLLVVDGPVYELVMAALNELRPIEADMFYELVKEQKQKREWVGLTDEEISQAMFRANAIVTGETQFTFAEILEEKLKEKNHDMGILDQKKA
jgi:hypothetical protein